MRRRTTSCTRRKDSSTESWSVTGPKVREWCFQKKVFPALLARVRKMIAVNMPLLDSCRILPSKNKVISSRMNFLKRLGNRAGSGR